MKHKWVLMTEEILTGVATETATGVAEAVIAVVVSEAAVAAPGKCTRLPVRTVVLRPKFHSNQPKGGRFIAETVFLTTESSKFRFST